MSLIYKCYKQPIVINTHSQDPKDATISYAPGLHGVASESEAMIVAMAAEIDAACDRIRREIIRIDTALEEAGLCGD